jgi:type I restriction enzyme S subunit
MAGELSAKTLGEICRFSGGAGFPQRLQGASAGDFPFIKVSDMELPGNGFRITKANNWVDEATRRELRAKAHPANSTVFAKIGIALTYNRRRLLTRPTIVDNNMMAAIPDETQVDPLFFYYLLKKTDFNEVVAGTALPYINASDLAKMKVDVPPLPEQKAIGSVLGALDDKIELNRRMNATLEAMARALFQSWFVDFEPVRAKLDGRQPAGMEKATADLFPEHLEDSPLGHIPKGWKAGTVVEGFNVTMGQSPPGDTYNEEGNGLPFYQGRTDFGFRFPTRRIYCSAPTRYAKPGDTLVSVRAPVGDINMANEECCIGRGVAAVRHKSGATSFTYHSIANLYPDFARFEAEGTVFGSINKASFEKLRFVIPPDEVVAVYERQAGPLDEQIRTIENQSRTLATLRETLLPKLLSGELTIN